MRIRRSRGAIVTALIALSALAACQRAPQAPPRHVILLLLDAARPDRFSGYGYPRQTTPEIDRLAERGVVFRRHYAQGTGTRVSVPALLYSRYYSVPLFPDDPQVPYASPDNLFRRPDDEQISFVQAFAAAGFTTAAISAHLWTGEDTPFAAEFGELDDLTTRYGSRRYPYPRARVVVDRAIEWIGEHREEDFFLYLHLMDTHYPHYFEADAQALFGARTYDARRFHEGGAPQVPPAELSAEDLRYIDALYDGSLRYADRQIGRLIGFLDREELLDGAVLAITSDHGEHLTDGPGGRPRPGRAAFSHGGPWLEPVARIPLILAAENRLPPGSFEGLSEGVDVGPTLLSLARAPLPEGKAFDGVDLTEVLAGSLEPKEQAVMHRSLRTATHKVLFRTRDPTLLGDSDLDLAGLEGRLYDLVADPAETEDLFARQPAVVGELLERYRRTMRGPYRRAEAAVTDEQPTAAFAIAAAHFETTAPLPRIHGNEVPTGWSRLPGTPHSAVVARGASEPLTIRFRVPDGPYRVFVGMAGRATVRIGDRATRLAAPQGMAPFGEAEVIGEAFEATIEPRPEELLRIFYVGFLPPGASLGSPGDDERSRRLKALGYIQ